MKILLVEDDIATLELMKEILSSFGVALESTSDSAAALEWIEMSKYDCIFLDLVMPQVNGFALSRAIRKSPHNNKTPVVIVTANDEPEVLKAAIEAGATYLIGKPVTRVRLKALLDSHVW
jgi:CheY-like chemotaxis protein